MNNEPIIVWKSVILGGDVAHLSPQEVQQLQDDLNDAVVAICADYGIE